jgi:hypothetical protein
MKASDPKAYHGDKGLSESEGHPAEFPCKRRLANHDVTETFNNSLRKLGGGHGYMQQSLNLASQLLYQMVLFGSPILGVNPLNKALGPSFLIRSLNTVAPDTLLSKLAFWIRV